MSDPSLPSRAKQIADDYPDIWAAYQALGKACSDAGPLDQRTGRLVKLALAVGNGSEGAVHSHVRRARDEGISDDEIRHVATLSVTTLGFPKSVAALSWIEDILAK